MKIVNFNRRDHTVTIELDYGDVEFIAMELPPQDGFTVEWARYVWRPMWLEGEQ